MLFFDRKIKKKRRKLTRTGNTWKSDKRTNSFTENSFVARARARSLTDTRWRPERLVSCSILRMLAETRHPSCVCIATHSPITYLQSIYIFIHLVASGVKCLETKSNVCLLGKSLSSVLRRIANMNLQKWLRTRRPSDSLLICRRWPCLARNRQIEKWRQYLRWFEWIECFANRHMEQKAITTNEIVYGVRTGSVTMAT